ncbi:RCC1 and BTB domain-containing protein 2-like [Oppia nitens]|uniref:RCC1 and BTB domain-containing protein 2-like n=1 Tax=Oppia nitens TaxID=1686743 RepID=UPI0023DA5220|nr:RCC1 and BTB domain-containing protein 2-like [Oppia nitens]
MSTKFVCEFNSETTCILITKNDQVYSIGYLASKIYSIPGNYAQFIDELSNETIEQFYNGNNYLLALNHLGQLYSMGNNYYGQLARSDYDDRFLIAQRIPNNMISDSTDSTIIMISCGYYHCLALTTNNRLYGWGFNGYQQIFVNNSYPDKIKTPSLLPDYYFDSNQINYIKCQGHKSIVLTQSGLVYYWGNRVTIINGNHQSSKPN